MAKIWDERLALIKSYAEHFETLDEKMADEIATKALDLRDRREKLHRKYYKKFKGELGSILSARFMQVDNIIQNIVDLQIAAELPLVTGSTVEGR